MGEFMAGLPEPWLEPASDMLELPIAPFMAVALGSSGLWVRWLLATEASIYKQITHVNLLGP